MNIDYRKYQNFYNDNYEKIKNAYECTVNNPCDKVAVSIESLKKYLTDKKNVSWSGPGREEFDESINAAIKNLDAIMNSITLTWGESERIYKRVVRSLEKLNTKCTELIKEIIYGRPKEKAYEKKIRDTEGNVIRIYYPGYSTAVDNWKDRCYKIDNVCKNLCNDIDNLLIKLKENDAVTISLVKSKFSSGWQKLEELVEKGWAIVDSSEIANLLRGGNSISEPLPINYHRDEKLNLLIVRYNQKQGQWAKKMYGVKLNDDGCSIMSTASVLTTLYSKKYEQDVLILPNCVADSFGNSLSNYVTDKDGFSGFVDGFCNKLSKNYNVAVLASSGGLSNEEMKAISLNNGCVIGSLKNKSHLVAINGVTPEGIEYVSDTSSSALRNIRGTENHTALKYYSSVYNESDIEIKDNKILLNGNELFNIGNVSKISLSGETNKVYRVADDSTGLYNYFIKQEL